MSSVYVYPGSNPFQDGKVFVQGGQVSKPLAGWKAQDDTKCFETTITVGNTFLSGTAPSNWSFAFSSDKRTLVATPSAGANYSDMFNVVTVTNTLLRDDLISVVAKNTGMASFTSANSSAEVTKSGEFYDCGFTADASGKSLAILPYTGTDDAWRVVTMDADMKVVSTVRTNGSFIQYEGSTVQLLPVTENNAYLYMQGINNPNFVNPTLSHITRTGNTANFTVDASFIEMPYFTGKIVYNHQGFAVMSPYSLADNDKHNLNATYYIQQYGQPLDVGKASAYIEVPITDSGYIQNVVDVLMSPTSMRFYAYGVSSFGAYYVISCDEKEAKVTALHPPPQYTSLLASGENISISDNVCLYFGNGETLYVQFGFRHGDKLQKLSIFVRPAFAPQSEWIPRVQIPGSVLGASSIRTLTDGCTRLIGYWAEDFVQPVTNMSLLEVDPTLTTVVKSTPITQLKPNGSGVYTPMNRSIQMPGPVYARTNQAGEPTQVPGFDQFAVYIQYVQPTPTPTPTPTVTPSPTSTAVPTSSPQPRPGSNTEKNINWTPVYITAGVVLLIVILSVVGYEVHHHAQLKKKETE